MEEIIVEFLKLVFQFPVWQFVFFVNFTSLVYHFSPLAKLKWIQHNRALIVFLTATFSASALGIRDLIAHDFIFSDEDILYQARLISSWAVAVLVYHIGGFKLGVRAIKKKVSGI